MLKNIEGIITRKLKYGETSMIIDLLTAEFGLRSFIVGGVRKKSVRSSSSVYQILNIVKAVVYDKDNDKLSRIKELSYGYVYKSIPFDVVKSSLATFILEVCRRAAQVSDDYPTVYNFIVKALVHLDNSEGSLAHFHIHFMINLAEILGFKLEDNYSSDRPYFDLSDGCFVSQSSNHRHLLSREDSLLLSHYLNSNGNPGSVKRNRQNLVQGLVQYYQYHVEGFGTLKSLDVLTTLFE